MEVDAMDGMDPQLEALFSEDLGEIVAAVPDLVPTIRRIARQHAEAGREDDFCRVTAIGNLVSMYRDLYLSRRPPIYLN
jgi:hypothetical protein